MELPNFPDEAGINDEEDGPLKVATLPDHLILDLILPRLPVKSLLRFKSVCRNWRSTISTPQFAKSHLSFSGSRHQFLILVKDNALVKNPNYRIFRANFKYGDSDSQIWIAGCCNGLVCFGTFVPDGLVYFGTSVPDSVVKFFVLNPATGQRIEILAHEDFENYTYYGYWFGYVSSVDDYMMAAFSRVGGAFWTLSWKTRIWKRISSSIDEYDAGVLMLRGSPVLINDSLYWPTDLFKWDCNVGTRIVEFNLVSEEYDVKPVMNFAYDDECVTLVNLKGYLALHTTSNRNCLDVWMLRQNDDWNSWEKVYSKVDRYVHLIYFSATGKLLIDHQKQLLKDGDFRRQLKIVGDLSQLETEEDRLGQRETLLCILSDLRGVADYVESLISPF